MVASQPVDVPMSLSSIPDLECANAAPEVISALPMVGCWPKGPLLTGSGRAPRHLGFIFGAVSSLATAPCHNAVPASKWQGDRGTFLYGEDGRSSGVV